MHKWFGSTGTEHVELNGLVCDGFLVSSESHWDPLSWPNDCKRCTFSKMIFSSFSRLSPSLSRRIFRFVLIQNIISGEHSVFFACFFTLFHIQKSPNKQYAYCLCDNLVSKCMQCLLNTFNAIYRKAFDSDDATGEWVVSRQKTHSAPVDAVSLESNEHFRCDACMSAICVCPRTKIHAHAMQRIQHTHYFVMPTIWLLFYCYHKFSSNWNVWKRKTRSNKSECFWLKHFVELLSWMNVHVNIHTILQMKFKKEKKNRQTK